MFLKSNARNRKCLKLQYIKNQHLIIDGFNLIITLDAAMAGTLLLRCRDGCIRNLASVHGTYRPVRETESVIERISHTLTIYESASVQWLFDKPVANSGRLAHLVCTTAETHGWKWQADLRDNPDRVISASNEIAITSDSAILDAVEHWLNLTTYILEHHFQDA